jgi:hypothetical protein
VHPKHTEIALLMLFIFKSASSCPENSVLKWRVLTSTAARVATALIVSSFSPPPSSEFSTLSLKSRIHSAESSVVLTPQLFTISLSILIALNCSVAWNSTLSRQTSGTKNAVVGFVSEAGCQGKD